MKAEVMGVGPVGSHFVYNKSQTDWPGDKPKSLRSFTEFVRLTYNQFSSYLTENTVRVLYKERPINDVQVNRYCLL